MTEHASRGSRPAPPRSRRRPALLAALALLALLALPAAGDTCAGVTPLSVEVRARALAPTEPLRIVARSPEPLAELRGSFLGRPVFMQPDDARTWSGWAMIEWDRRPGPAVVELSGTTSGGGEARGTHAVSVVARAFPEERLTVESRYVTPPPEVEARLVRERELLARVYAARRETPPLAAPFVKPVPGEFSSVFGTRRILNGQPRDPHSGLDLRGDTGTPVGAAGPGLVVLAQELYYSGNVVIVDHGGGLFTLYAHLSRIDVEVGRAVRAGDTVGLLGATGRVTGPHLHWGAKIGDRPFDPSALLDPALFT